jgi:hypothetical protein
MQIQETDPEYYRSPLPWNLEVLIYHFTFEGRHIVTLDVCLELSLRIISPHDGQTHLRTVTRFDAAHYGYTAAQGGRQPARSNIKTASL